ncbi:CYFA0S01e00188g1_1 [Cyberlindnera fabianii]|uniref:Uridine kinase n=1 Tax=Cyberlindnera fabianii TaxID=36022 RepID=A0A061AFC5_CYBFA|nr:CYFA0S01e00188g1_1 [Cyberlindnera fabianii]
MTSSRQRRGSRIAPSASESFFSTRSHEPSVDAASPSGTESHSHDQHYVPPWTEPYIIGVAGPSGSGKTSVASRIIQEINTPWTVLLSLDNFYKPLTEEERKLAYQSKWDFDTPDSIDLDLVYECVKSLKEGRKTQIPIYSFEKHNRTDRSVPVYGANVIVVEGIYALYSEKLNNLMNMKIYVDTDLDICLARRLNRDILHRGRDLAGVIQQWNDFVKPNAERYVKPTMRVADLIVPRGSENTIGINMLIRHIKKQLALKSQAHIEQIEKLTGKLDLSTHPNLKSLEQTNQTRGIYTILLNKCTERDDFIFYFDRIATTLISRALELTEYTPVTITTPLAEMTTVKSTSEVIAVNIIRSGDCFMHSLRKTLPEIAIGKLLIQSDSTTGEPQLHAESLPRDIAQKGTKVLLMDAQIISGAAVIMAIQVLTDHGVRPENITVVTYLAMDVGLGRVLSAFKGVNVVVGQVGKASEMDEKPWFRKRFIDEMYFGT